MNKIEMCRKKVEELDARMKVLDKEFITTMDSERRDALYEEIMSVARATNRWLAAAGADESEMYDI